MSLPLAGRLALALTVATVGCAARTPRPAPPRPAAAGTAAPELQPPPEALRLAQKLRPTGLELGTMWTFEDPPLEYWRKQYGFQATPQWLEHVRLSSVRFANYCSASFVSPAGLVMTNHHCGRECVEAQSTPGHDYVETGFYAATRAEERVCPNVYLDQLVSIEDVTQRVTGAAAAGAADAARTAAVDSASARIQRECEQQTKLVCQVVSLYHGGQYHLYRYRRYQPVKLVFAPELQAGFFGGDADNFTYPRYALDVTFVRAYQADGTTPASTPNYFQWDAGGPGDGELVFTVGNPASTSRLITVAQLMYERAYRHPFYIAFLEAQRSYLQELARRSPQTAQQVRQDLFEVENSLKAFRGEMAGLLDTLLLARKVAWQTDFERRLNADTLLRSRYGDVFDRMAAIQAEKLRLSPELNLSNPNLFPEPHMQAAATLVRLVRERSLPEAQRSTEFRGEKLQQLTTRLGGELPLDTALSRRLLASRLRLMQRFLPPDNALLRQAVESGEEPDAAARRLVTSTRIGDAAFRRALLQGGEPAVDTTHDPLVRLVGAMLANARTLQPRWDSLMARQDVQAARLAQALFAAYGTSVPPDATFTPRISDGLVRGYPYNGTLAPPMTTIYGLYGRSAEFGNRMPFTLPASFARERAAVDLEKPLNLVSTNDISGGNSGSPLIDRTARVVGLVFDSNIEALPHQFLYGSESGRTVSVHTAGITEALRSVYHADALLRELLGQPPAPAAAPR